jgi:hypothetical protein
MYICVDLENIPPPPKCLKDTHRLFALSCRLKRDDIAVINFAFLCSNIPLSSAYGVYILQLIRYARACYAYENFLKRCQLKTTKFDVARLKRISFN